MFIIENETKYSVIKNIDKYIDLYLQHGVLSFKEINLSQKDQFSIIQIFGDKLGWHPNSSSDYDEYCNSYEKTIQAHDFTFSQEKDPKTSLGDPKRNLFLVWHLEYAGNLNNPIISGCWNMHKFTCKPEYGQTGFVNATSLFEKMPLDWKNFLLDSIIQDVYPNYLGEKLHRSAVLPHFYTKEPVLRIDPFQEEEEGWYGPGERVILISQKGLAPTEDQKNKFKKIKKWITNEVYENKNNQIWYSWSQGDLLFVDLMRMYHAVSPGFKPGEREFINFWCRKDKFINPNKDFK